MTERKYRSARKKRLINNTLVYVILAILAVIWVFPILWGGADKFPGGKRLLCVHFLSKSIYTGQLCEIVYRYICAEFPSDVYEHFVYRGLLLYTDDIFCPFHILLSVPAAL